MQQTLRVIFLVSFFCLVTLFPKDTFAVAGIKTDYGLYAVPPVPVFSGAGSVIVDPVFGTSIMKVTDVNDGLECTTNYSYWPSFNKDVTWLMVGCTTSVSYWQEPVAIFYKWDGANFKITNKVVKDLTLSKGLDLSQGIWSALDPNVMYVWKGDKLYTYNILTDQATLVKDFSTIFPGEYQFQFHRSMDDDVFSFTRKRHSDYGVAGYAVWKKSTDQIIKNVTTSELDEVQIDKTGKYLVVKTGQSGPTVVEGKVINLITGATTNLLDGTPDFDLGHSDNGSGIQVGEQDWDTRIWKYDLANPSQKTALTPDLTLWKSSGGHYSMLSDDESWVLGSGSGLTPELYLIATDGSQRIKRIAHYNSVFNSYSDTARPNISRDGKFVAFTSNWGGTNRRDLYVVTTFERGGVASPAAPVPVDTTAPIATSVTSVPAQAGATITWLTNEAADTQVEFGVTAQYGSVSSLNPSLSSSHTVVLSGLTSNTTYHYRVKSRDAAGNIHMSGDYAFTTLLAPTPIPSISESACLASGTGVFSVCFYDNVDFTNLKAFKSENSFNYNWGLEAPVAGIGADTFSVTGEGIFYLPSGVYTFTTSSDDGIRVFVDGTRIINNFNDHAEVIDTGTISLSTGNHKVRVEFYDNTNHAVAKLSWLKTAELPVETVPTPIPAPTPTPTPIPTEPIPTTPTATTTTPVTKGPKPKKPRAIVVTKSLSRSVEDPQVADLQVFLKEAGYLDESIETTTFYGSATEGALKNYQASIGLEPTGAVGPLTRAALMIAKTDDDTISTPLVVGATTETQVSTSVFPKTVYFGMTDSDVVRLQNILKRLGFFPQTEPSSGYFGSRTRKAVQTFQRAYSIVSSGNETTTGYGMVGKITWTKLLSL